MVFHYKNKLPVVDDVVIAKVIDISPYGIKITLSEYNDVEGFINCGEASRKKRVSFNKIFTVGKEVFVIVTNVDANKNFVDVSKRTIGDEDIKLFTEKHKTHIQLYNMFKQIYVSNMDELNVGLVNDLDMFMERTLWNIQSVWNDNGIILDMLLGQGYGHANGQCQEQGQEQILDAINYDDWIDAERFKQMVNTHIETKVNRTKPEIVHSIKLLTYECSGLSDIKYTLDYESYRFYEEFVDFEIEMNYITGSSYVIKIKQKDYDLVGNLNIEVVLQMLRDEIVLRATEKCVQHQV